MALRILGGQAKGFRVSVLSDKSLRPMSCRLKRRPFDAHQDLSSWHFVDLCGGSGAVGLEAWSRGARSVLFYEKKTATYRQLMDNIERFQGAYDCSQRPIRAILGDCLKWFKGEKGGGGDTLLFFGPPYGFHELYHKFFKALASGGFRGRLWVESDCQKGVSLEEINYYAAPLKVYEQGTTFLCVCEYADRQS